MKLKQIPNNTVVHTPAEAEAKELLAILHENEFTFCSGDSLLDNNWLIDLYDNADELECLGIALYIHNKSIQHCQVGWYRKKGYVILTLSEFKKRYVLNEDNFAKSEEEKPQVKLKKGDKCKVINDCGCNAYGLVGVVELVEPRQIIVNCGTDRLFCPPEWIEPYTEPETKTNEDMEAIEKEQGEKGNNSENPQLNLCELLARHKTEYFYSPLYGRMSYTSERDGLLYFESLQGKVITLFPNGHSQFTVEGYCGIFPSRDLYEQYPLDPYTAWMKWQEEQTIFHIRIEFQPYEERGEMKCGNMGTLHFDDLKFRTPADRDKCISEINAIIDKYSKK